MLFLRKDDKSFAVFSLKEEYYIKQRNCRVDISPGTSPRAPPMDDSGIPCPRRSSAPFCHLYGHRRCRRPPTCGGGSPKKVFVAAPSFHPPLAPTPPPPRLFTELLQRVGPPVGQIWSPPHRIYIECGASVASALPVATAGLQLCGCGCLGPASTCRV